MKEKKRIPMKKVATIFLILFIVVSIIVLAAKELGKKEGVKETEENSSLSEKSEKLIKKDHLNVYYFHTTQRCSSCHKIENYTKKTINLVFKKKLDSGTIVFKELNVDKPENAHFIKDFKLYTKSVIVEQMKNGKKKKWKNLEKVWELLGDESAFSFYIQTEIEKQLKETE